MKTEVNNGTVRSRDISPLSDSMMSEEDNDGFIKDVITHEMPHDSQEESVISNEMHGTDLHRTLGEILGYCQVTYGAILKLEEKFDILQAKVANIQTLHQNSSALLFQKTCGSSGEPDSIQRTRKSLPTPTSDLSIPHLPCISSSPSVESRKLPKLSPRPEPTEPLRLDIQNQPHNLSLNINQTKQKQGRVNGSTRIRTDNTDPAKSTTANLCCVGNSKRKVFLSNSILHSANKMARPSTAVRYLLRKMFTTEQLSQSSTTGNASTHLKRLDPNKISAVREWAVRRYPKFDLRENGKEWKICLSVVNSMARYTRLVGKTCKQKMNATEPVSPDAEVSSHTAEIDVELSDSDTEQKLQETQSSRLSFMSDCDRPTDVIYKSDQCGMVHLGSPHRDVKVPMSALSKAHMRKRPELIARYLIKFIFPVDVLVHSNVYGARQGIMPLNHNKISALREHLSKHFPKMKLGENGCDWKVCVGAINSTIRKCRYEQKMGIKRGVHQDT